jgi:adenylate cyclase
MRVPRSFAFVDLSGFTDYTATFGDEEAGRVLAHFRAVTRQVASDHGVRIAKWLGDGCMLVGMDSVESIAAVLDVEHRAASACAPLSVRAGLSSGLALLFEGDDYVGAAVNLAARLCDAAGPSELLVPAEQAAERPEGIEASEPRLMALRGFPEPLEVVALRGVPTAVARHDTGELWTRTPFVA